MLLSSLVASLSLLAAGTSASLGHDGYHVRPVRRQDSQATVKVHVVRVGDAEGNLKFSPETVEAEAGSMLQFHFYPKNHSVVQSSFDSPCTPMGDSAIKSGFMPVADDAAEMPVFTVMVNDTKPMWFYCGQTPHCQNGMVMAVNPATSGDKTLEAYKQLAAQVDSSTNSTPSASWPTPGNSTGSATAGGAVLTASSSVLPNANLAPKRGAQWTEFCGLAVVALAMLWS